MQSVVTSSTDLGALARLFLRLGATAFGGPAVHIALMEEEVVVRRAWLSRTDFLDLVGATNLIPGPNSTELALHIGHRRAGWRGLVVAGVCFILPAALLVGAFGWAYARFGRLPAVAAVLTGVKPMMIAVVLQALVRLARTAIKSRALALLALSCAGLAAAGVHELIILIAAAFVAAARLGHKRTGLSLAMAAWPISAVVNRAITTPKIFFVFLKIGSVLFGSGYVLLSFLRADLVQRLGWLTQSQLLDAVTVGQITPGPVFTTATFIGYLLRGPVGAVAATIGIFLPAFVFVAVSGWLVPRLRQSAWVGAALDGVNAASLALMAVVTWQLFRTTVFDPVFNLGTLVLAAVGAVLLFGFRLNTVLLVAVGAIAGWLRVWI